MNLVIIGGGAAGLAAAITAAQQNQDKRYNLYVLEQNSHLGKKITASGNGHCNITNSNLLPSQYYFDPQSTLVTNTLKQVGFNELSNFFQEVGILFSTKPDGRTYPFTQEAKAVSQTLQLRAQELGVRLLLEAKVHTITYDKQFQISYMHHNQMQTLDATAVIIATGSPAAAHLGGNSDVIALTKPFGHTARAFFPSLVQLHTKESLPNRVKGVRLEAEVSLYVNKEFIRSERHDLLFTHYGLSGLAVLDLSHSASEALTHHHYVSLRVNFLPMFSTKTVHKKLLLLQKQFGSRNCSVVLSMLLAKKLSQALTQQLSIDATPLATLSSKQLLALSKQITQHQFTLTQTHGFKHAEVSGGGVDLSEISNSFESNLQRRLYLCGEALDVTGRRGGYNLHFAFASGMIAATQCTKALDANSSTLH